MVLTALYLIDVTYDRGFVVGYAVCDITNVLPNEAEQPQRVSHTPHHPRVVIDVYTLVRGGVSGACDVRDEAEKPQGVSRTQQLPMGVSHV